MFNNIEPYISIIKDISNYLLTFVSRFDACYLILAESSYPFGYIFARVHELSSSIVLFGVYFFLHLSVCLSLCSLRLITNFLSPTSVFLMLGLWHTLPPSLMFLDYFCFGCSFCHSSNLGSI